MNTSVVWVVVLLAFVLANLPFFNERLFSLIRLSAGQKGLALRLLELVILYFLAGGVGLAIEHNQGQIYPQGWEFYAVTGSMFLTFAFPGFVYRYLRRHR